MAIKSQKIWPFVKKPWHNWKGESLKPQKWWHLGALIPVVFLGLTPYLGLMTTSNFSMFSNLRTEGVNSNHLLLSNNPLKIFNYQEDLVRVLNVGVNTDSKDPIHNPVMYEKGESACNKEQGCQVIQALSLIHI